MGLHREFVSGTFGNSRHVCLPVHHREAHGDKKTGDFRWL